MAKSKSVDCCSENKAIGLALGLLLAGAHLLWLILVYIGIAKILMDWIMSLHMLRLPYTITPFSAGNAIILLAITFVVGYILGWILAGLLKMSRNQK